MICKLVHNKEIHMLSKKVTYDGLISYIKTTFKKLPKHFSLSYKDKDGDIVSVSNQSDLQIWYQANLSSLRLIIQEVQEEFIKNTESFGEIAQVVQADRNQNTIVDKQPSITNEIKESKLYVSISQAELVQTISDKIESLMPQLTKKLAQSIISPKHSTSRQSKSPIHDRVSCDGCKKEPIIGIRYKCSVCPNFDYCEQCENDQEHPHAFLKIRTPDQVPPLIYASSENNLESQKQPNNLGGNLKNIFQSFMPNANCSKDKIERRRYGKVLKKYLGQKLNQEKSGGIEKQKQESKVQENEKKDFQQTQEKEDRQLTLAYELEQILNIDFLKVLRFVQRHPNLSKQQLIQAYYSGFKVKRFHGHHRNYFC